MKIYTRKGDDGKTALIGGDRVSKHHIRVESYGTIDELNSHLGFLRCGLDEEEKRTIAHIQNRLFTVGSYLASASGSKMVLPEILSSDVKLLENEIDRHTSELPELKNFIYLEAQIWVLMPMLPDVFVEGQNVWWCMFRR